jgi:hypothetical protein
MDFIENLRTFISKRAPVLDQIKSEDQAKLSLVFPFLRNLGYDTTDPNEIVPEFTSDFATKKGEKVDIAIMVNGEPAVLIECKAPGADLTAHNGQLYRYFSVTKSKFAILTNGIDYWFFSDVDEPNKMDSKPFMTINLFDASDADLQELQRFEKSNFDPTEVAESAEQLKKMSLVKNVIARELKEPSDELVRLVCREVYQGRLTQAKLEEFKLITSKAIKEHQREYLNAHLQKAIDRISEDPSEYPAKTENTSEPDTAQEDETSGIAPIEEDALRVIKAILARDVSPERLTLRDGKAYNTLLLDGKGRKRIAIFKVGKRKNVIEILDTDTTKFSFDSIEEIYQYNEAFRNALSGQLE